jgi:hypothetical protein
MKKASTSILGRKRSTTRDLTARKAGVTKGGIIAVLIGLLRPQPEPQTITQLNTRPR